MNRETFRLGTLALTEGELCGRHYKSINELDALAEKVIALLRPEKIPICQVKDIMERVCRLVDLEPLT